MNRELLSKALCEIDESFIAEAYRPVPEAASGSSERIVHMKKKRIITFALAAALILALGAVAYAAGWFGLDGFAKTQRTIEVGFTQEEIDARNQVVEDAVARGEGPAEALAEIDEKDFPRPTETLSLVCLLGPADSPESMACVEYMDFLETYDTDKAILRSIGNRPTGFETDYGPYTCYTQEMADKIDEICQRYSLKKLSGFQIPETPSRLYYLAGTGSFAPKQDVPSGQKLYPIAVWADGSFRADGCVRKGLFAEYQVSRCVKGSFVTWALVQNPNSWSGWQYTTENGAELLLAQDGERALILADRPESFVIVGVHSNKELGCEPASLEAFAELFDFTVIP